VWRHPVFKLLFLTYVAWGAWNWLVNRPVHPADGILAGAEPQQGEAPPGPPRRMGRWTLTPRATYQITARILGVERYHFDVLAGLVPEDLALGWGPLSDNGVLNTMDITQSNRFFFWRSRGLLSRDIIISHSANTHVIPQDSEVARQLAHLRRGQVVALTGELVDALRDDGASLRTSLAWTDTGAGACEVMLVRVVRLVP
jgi:hypothetical protein